MGGSKAYEMMEDYLQRRIKFGKKYIVTANPEGGWPMFWEADAFKTKEEKKRFIEHKVSENEFVGLVQFFDGNKSSQDDLDELKEMDL